MTETQQILEAIKRLETGQKSLQVDVKDLQQSLSHTNTAIKSLPTTEDLEAGIDTAKTEILSAVLALDSKVVTKVHKHDKSIKSLHEGTEVPDPNLH